MSWKDELIKKLNELATRPTLTDDEVIEVSYSVPWGTQWAIHEAISCVNLYPISWVGPGYLMLFSLRGYRTKGNTASGVLIFRVSHKKKYNEVGILNTATGQFKAGEITMFESVDFMSL